MVSKIALVDLRGLYELDDQCIAALKEHKAFLVLAFGEAFDALLEHLDQFQLSTPLYQNEGTVSSKELHMRHWGLILDGQFGDEYKASVRSLFRMRRRTNIESQWFIGSSSFVTSRILEAIALRLPGNRISFFAKARRAKLRAAVLKVVMVDIGYAIDVFRESSRQYQHQTFNDLALSFEKAIGGIASHVLSTAEHLRITASGLTHSAESTNLQSMAAAAASKQAATSVEAISAATHHLSLAVGEISAQAHQSNRIAGQAAGEVDRTRAEVRRLAEVAERIGGIVELIRNIAGQTNMLALNATIEAARAGDAGRGFAIVAQEVKSLADATARATAEIGAQVNGIQDAAQHVGSFIASIASTTQEVSAIAVAVEQAVAQQARMTQEIALRIEEASKGTHDVTSNIVGASQSAGDSSLAAKALLTSATELTRQAEVLSKHVEDFLGTVRAA